MRAQPRDGKARHVRQIMPSVGHQRHRIGVKPIAALNDHKDQIERDADGKSAAEIGGSVDMTVTKAMMMSVIMAIMVVVIMVMVVMCMGVPGSCGIVMMVVVRRMILRVTVIGLHVDSLTVEFLG